MLAKISILGPEYFENQLANKGPDILPATDALEEGSPAKQHVDQTLGSLSSIHPDVSPQAEHKGLSPSEALRQKHQHLSGIELLAKQFGGKIVDLSNDSVIVEMVDAFLKLVRPYGILEAARSGLMVMPRGEQFSELACHDDTFDVILTPPRSSLVRP